MNYNLHCKKLYTQKGITKDNVNSFCLIRKNTHSFIDGSLVGCNILKLEAVCSYEMPVPTYKFNSEKHQNLHCHENLELTYTRIHTYQLGGFPIGYSSVKSKMYYT
jgi:hypothetical protein